ncbi:uncharacterized protein LTR77_008698 [Saxophila tyrrhenica]|uniref:FAD dependent oxidoreductase domain-containing protein n=1 Tax=Saxophila tyrrhenica TaxID=1690608 RepID=A0AAV9NZY1_9PEZI|nr:hypothetical protein LTR77_008698 [Saxophila tyrrhenica]
MHSRFTGLRDRLNQDPGLPLSNPTTSYWQQPESEQVATIQSASLPGETDVVIIGSGITGCSIAEHLLSNDGDVRVTVLEARNICSGATGRNGGNIKAVPEHSIAELGAEKARDIVHFTLANVEALLKLNDGLSPALQKAGEVRRVETMNVFTTQAGFDEFSAAVREFDDAYPELRGRGRLVEREELGSKHGIHNAVGGYLASAGAGWPYRLITGIFAELLQRHSDRFSIEAQTPVQNIDSTNAGGYLIQTSRGPIKAKTIIHATNGHAAHLLPGLRGPLFPVRGQMTTQMPTAVSEKYAGGRSWSLTYDHGFDYVIQSPSSNEIFAGGGLGQAYERGLAEIGNTDDSVNSVLALAHMGGAMNAVFGIEPDRAMTSGVKSAWTGIMGFTSDGLPLVGRLPQEATMRQGQGEWISAGFNGYGMVNAWLCGKHVAESVLDKEKPEFVPKAYEVSLERLKGMSADDGANYWIAALGLD